MAGHKREGDCVTSEHDTADPFVGSETPSSGRRRRRRTGASSIHHRSDDCSRTTDVAPIARRHHTNDPPRTAGATQPMATDYDAPRKTDDDLSEDSIEELKARRVDNPRRASTWTRPSRPRASSCPAPTSPARSCRCGSSSTGRRVHPHRVLPGAPPQPAGERQGRQDGLPRVRGLTDALGGHRRRPEQRADPPPGSALTASSSRRGGWPRSPSAGARTPATPAPTCTRAWT